MKLTMTHVMIGLALIFIATGVGIYLNTPSQAQELHPDCYGNDWPAILTQFHIDCVNKAVELGIIK